MATNGFLMLELRKKKIQPLSFTPDVLLEIRCVGSLVLLTHHGDTCVADVERMQSAIYELHAKTKQKITVVSISRVSQFSLPDLKTRRALVHCIRAFNKIGHEIIILRDLPAYISIPLDTLTRALLALAKTQARLSFFSSATDALKYLNTQHLFSQKQKQDFLQYALENSAHAQQAS